MNDYREAGDRVRYWGRVGSFWGALWGLWFGCALIYTPGANPLLMTGPLVCSLYLGLAGAMVLGGLSAIGAGLYQLGIYHEDMFQFEPMQHCGQFARIDLETLAVAGTLEKN